VTGAVVGATVATANANAAVATANANAAAANANAAAAYATYNMAKSSRPYLCNSRRGWHHLLPLRQQLVQRFLRRERGFLSRGACTVIEILRSVLEETP
jgi:hypothetical protein